MSISVGILGAAGRMGQMLIATAEADAGTVVKAAVDRAESPLVGTAFGEFTLTADTAALFRDVDVAIDFTLPSATAEHARLAAEHGTGWVLGTTGLDDDLIALVKQTATKAPVMFSANYSLGVNLLSVLVEQAAQALGEGWDIEITETHHNQKVDAPSGTALMLGRAAAKGRDVALADVQRLSREGQTGIRPAGEIGFATLRGGDVAGEHHVNFFGTAERIEIGHRATSREIFAKGAVHAAKWLAGREAGLYSMRDALEI